MARHAEVSNTLMIVHEREPDADGGGGGGGGPTPAWSIETALGTYVELTPTPAPLDKLAVLLERWPYAGAEAEADNVAAAEAAQRGTNAATARRRYTLDDLLDRVPASVSELRKGLAAVHAFELDGTEAPHAHVARSNPANHLTVRPPRGLQGGGAV